MIAEAPVLDIDFPEKCECLFGDYRYVVFWGGRDGVKSWSVARYLLCQAVTHPELILCTREFQASIRDSVHKLLKDQISYLCLDGFFEITEREIRTIPLPGKDGSTWTSSFIFKGLHNNTTEIKSTEGVTICWVEEAQKVGPESWKILIPTMRQQGSKIIVTFNPGEEQDDTYVRFVPRCTTCIKTFEDNLIAEDHAFHHQDHSVKLPPPNSRVIKTSFRDNLWTSPEMDKEREYLRQVDPEGYAHVYEGETMAISEAIIFKNKYFIHNWETPTDPLPLFRHGADYGFASSPACLMRCYQTDEPAMPDPRNNGRMLPAGPHLWVDMESYGFGVEQDDLPKLYSRIPTSKTWPIKADAARPETTSHLRGKGLTVESAKKWQGCVEDGIYHLKTYVLIHIHETNCPQFQVEARMYRYKIDRNKVDDRGKPLVLPIIIDAWNHGWDAIRYSLDGHIKSRGGDAVWGRNSGWLK